jgi:hypothetical protein
MFRVAHERQMCVQHQSEIAFWFQDRSIDV